MRSKIVPTLSRSLVLLLGASPKAKRADVLGVISGDANPLA
jgi:hypothetical protein